MISEEKISDLFAGFIRSGNDSSELKQIYESMPYLTPDQQRILILYKALAVKYNSKVLHEICSAVESQLKGNRKLGFKYTRLVESMALYKHFKGYRASANMNEDGN